ncbi:hypothetical protein Tco_1277837 [Tanacetum coccineum]
MRPEIANNVTLEIKGPFTKEFRENTFAGNRDDDTYEHVQKVLEIVDLFSIPGVDHDAIMLRVFPKTLKGTAKRWKDILSLGSIDTWPLLEKAFIQNLLSSFKNRQASHDDAIKNLDTKIGLQTNDIQAKILGGAPSSLTFVNHCKSIFTNDGLPLYMPFDYFFNETGDLSSISYVSEQEI